MSAALDAIASAPSSVSLDQSAVEAVVRLLKIMSETVSSDPFTPGVKYLTTSEIASVTRASSHELSAALNLLADAGLLRSKTEDVSPFAWGYCSAEKAFDVSGWMAYGDIVEDMSRDVSAFVHSGFRGQYSELERCGLIQTEVSEVFDSQKSRMTPKGKAFFAVMKVLHPAGAPEALKLGDLIV